MVILTQYRTMAGVLFAGAALIAATPSAPAPAEATLPPLHRPEWLASIEDGETFLTSDRCIACHKGVSTSTGEDVSIGYDWRASMMANSGRDPYWHAAVRREVMDFLFDDVSL